MNLWDLPCEHQLGDALCGVTPTRRFGTGRTCVDHQPARLAGRPDPPKPDPAMTAAGLLTAAREARR